MARALWFLALLSAFFVVAVRCLSGAAASAPRAVAASSAEARSTSPDQDEPLASADLDDDSDDSADPMPSLAPAVTRLVTFTDTKGTRLECGALVAQRPLPSHATSLDRPPRV